MTDTPPINDDNKDVACRCHPVFIPAFCMFVLLSSLLNHQDTLGGSNPIACKGSRYQITRDARDAPYQTDSYYEEDGCVTFTDKDPTTYETGRVKLCGSYRIVTCK